MKKTLSTILIIVAAFLFASCGNSDGIDISLIPVRQGDNWGYINKKGEYIINPQFDDAEYFSDGLAKVVVKGQIGYIDKEGNFVIPAKYKAGTDFVDGLAFVVAAGEAPVCVNKKGETVFTLQNANRVWAFSEGLAKVELEENGFGFVNKKGEFVINPQFKLASDFREGMAIVLQNDGDKFGYIDKSGKIVINPQFDFAAWFSEGLAAFENNDKIGFIDKKGKYVINPQFDRIGLSFHEGLCMFKNKGGDWGYIDKKGKIVINQQFEDAGNFHSGLAMVAINDRLGYISKDGKIAINPQFDRATPFIGNIAFVKSGDRWGIINKKGEFTVNPQFDKMKMHRKLDKYEPENDYVTSDYFDVSPLANAFFDSDAAWYYKKFLGKTLNDLINDPKVGNLINSSYNSSSVYYNGDFNISGKYKISSLYFYAKPGKEFYEYNNYFDKEYQLGTPVDGVRYGISVLNDFDERICGAFAKWIEKKYDLEQVKLENEGSFQYIGKDKSNTYYEVISSYGGLYFCVMSQAYYDRYYNEEAVEEVVEEAAVEYPVEDVAAEEAVEWGE